MQSSKERILIGKIKGAHGTKGALLVQSFTAKTPDIQNYKPLFLSNKPNEPIVLRVIRLKEKGLLIAALPNIQDRTQAESLKGIEIYALRESFPTLNEDTYYYADLVGLEVSSQQGVSLGKVTHVANFGAGDILEIILVHTSAKVLIPFSKEMILEINFLKSQLVVDADLFEVFASQDKESDDGA